MAKAEAEMVGRKRATATTVTVVVKNLPTGTTHHHLHALCHKLKGVVEVDIPARTAIYHKFIFGFVRFVSLESAVDGVDKLNGLVVQRRRLSAELGRCHWRNTNHWTVVVDEDEMGDGDVALSEEEVNTTIMQLCQRQWYQHHSRQHPHRDLPSFKQIMRMVCNLSSGEDDEDGGCGEVDWTPLDLDPIL